MFKRFIIGILSIVMAAAVLTGCTFFDHNYDRDYRQVVAVVKSYEIENLVGVDEDGNNITSTYKTAKRTIYKRDLVEYINSNQTSLSQQYNTAKSLVNHAIEMLIDTELVINEVDALIDAGLIEWGQAQENTVKQRIYGVIDGSIISIQNELLESRNKPTIDTDLDALNEETTYPVKPAEKVDDDDDEVEPEPWKPDLSSYPGLFGDSDERSLGRQAMREFISLLKNRVKDDFRLTKEDKAKFKEDDKKIDEIIDTQGISYVYGMIGDTHYMYYISGKNIERSVKINEMQTYLTDAIEVEENEVVDRYQKLLNGQKSTYDADVSLFESAMSGGSTTILYYPNPDYFYVKHILLPFSDEQKAAFDQYKENATDEQIEAYRARMVDNIVCYPHVAGEDDKLHPMTVNEVLNEIKATMLPLESNVMLADAAFDDLIYKYNTDPGAFGNNKGYVVKNSESGNNYMQEFTDGALYMRKELEVGQVYYEPVITDYGVHIMYFASTTKTGEVGLNDYTTPGKLETYYDIIEDSIHSTKAQVRYSAWERTVLTTNYKKQSVRYEDRYSDLWKS
ncbi:MAG: hypothetical protein J1G38_01695 [Clostridiales bacterium]|nr:hypothetical protein [Clostridiales bacterium]